MKRLLIYFAIILGLLFSSCMKDDEFWNRNQHIFNPPPTGVFITCEGNFMSENASLSFYDIAGKKVENDIFFRRNKLFLGDVCQSITIRDSLGYLVINNSGKIYVININTFQVKGKITGLASPRYMHFINDEKAYVTDLYAKAIAIVNPKTFKKIGSIDVNNTSSKFYQHSTEQMVQYEDKVFVSTWSFDNKVLVIDSKKDAVIDSITVTKQPNSIVMDKNNKIWVLSDGGYSGTPYGQAIPALTKIDAKTHKIEKVIKLKMEDSPTELTINRMRDTLFFLNKNVCSLAVDNPRVNTIIKSPYQNITYGGYYGLGIDPVTSEIYVADAIDFMQSGMVYRFRPNATPIDTFKVGIIPGSFAFK